jgi:DNA-binding MarR family transcriptional regulator/GNAT superfamily N-acetyltransferase
MTIPIRTQLDARAQAMRSFNRFYTRRIGVVRDRLLDSDFSLAEVRVLYELAHADGLTAKALCERLSVDAGYLSRMLNRFEKQRLLVRRAAKDDARQRELSLTPRGRRAFAPLDRRAHDEIADLLRALPPKSQDRVIAAMREIEALIAPAPGAQPPMITIRAPSPGDLGWVVRAHGAIYASEFGYDVRFEALVARIVSDFVAHFDPKTDGCWIAEVNGEPTGSVFIVRKSKTVAKLRLFIVDPSARGLGIGKRLVEDCIAFARRAGYRKITLWTQSELAAARTLYERAGFVRVASEKHRSFGKALVAETWELSLR